MATGALRAVRPAPPVPLADDWPMRADAVAAVVSATSIALAAEAGSDAAGLSGPAWSGVDHDEFLRAARVHRIAPILASQADAVDAPEAIRTRLRTMAKRDVVSGFVLAGQAARAVAAVAAAGVPVAVFKGVALSAQTTGEVTSRAGGDIDLLVRPDDLHAVHRALTSAGWKGDELADPGRRLSWYLRMRRECSYTSAESLIDLHWRVGWHDQPLPATEELLERAVPVSLGDVEVPTLSPPDALAAACYHAAVDRYARLRGLVDVVRLVRRGDAALPAGSHWRLRRVVGESVAFTDELIGGMPTAHVARFVPGRGVDVARVRAMWAHSSVRRIWSEYDVPLPELVGVYRDSARYAGAASAIEMALTDGLLPPERITPGMGTLDLLGSVTGELADLVRRRLRSNPGQGPDPR